MQCQIVIHVNSLYFIYFQRLCYKNLGELKFKPFKARIYTAQLKFQSKCIKKEKKNQSLPYFQIIDKLLLKSNWLQFFLRYNNLRNMTYSPDQSASYQNLYCQIQDLSEQKHGDQENVVKINPTVEENKETKKYQSRSKKKFGKVDYEISFQSNILHSHLQAFAIIFRQHYEKLQSHSKTNCLNFQFKMGSALQNFDYCEWIIEEVRQFSGLNEDQKSQLAEDWQKEQYLVKFLKIIGGKLDQTLKTEIYYLTSLIWEKYLDALNLNDKTNQSIPKLINLLLTSDFEKTYESPYLLQLTLSQFQNKECKKSFLSFIQKFSQTIYLIIEGYFSNPYSDDTQDSISLKQQIANNFDWQNFEEQDFLQLGLPRKMPKLD